MLAVPCGAVHAAVKLQCIKGTQFRLNAIHGQQMGVARADMCVKSNSGSAYTALV